MINQRTLAAPAQASGIGIHTGKPIQITLHPAAPNTGIIFRRVDLNPVIEIPAMATQVGDTRLNTGLTHQSAHISTVEHVLSAFAGLGIDNAYIDIDGIETPVMDGSALPFVSLIYAAGVEEQDLPKQFLRIKQKVAVQDGDRFVSLEPHHGCKFSLTIDFDHPVIKATEQTAEIDFTQASFAQDISGARTFGFLSEYEYLKKNNLGLGASLENTVVLDENRLLNPEGLRYKDEFARHKLLDVIGDLYLLKHNIIGKFVGYKSGHALTHKLTKALLSDPTSWEITPWDSELPVSFDPTLPLPVFEATKLQVSNG